MGPPRKPWRRGPHEFQEMSKVKEAPCHTGGLAGRDTACTACNKFIRGSTQRILTQPWSYVDGRVAPFPCEQMFRAAESLARRHRAKDNWALPRLGRSCDIWMRGTAHGTAAGTGQGISEMTVSLTLIIH